jgi:hypothetical protein
VDIGGWVFGSLRGRCRAHFVACVSLAILPLMAAAQEDTTRVTTRVDPCVQIDRESFHRVLAIELGSAIEYSAESVAQGSLTTVTVSCADGGIELDLADGVTRKSMRRVVDLAPVEPGARSRLLALTVAEFVVASWVELRLPEPAPVEPVGPAPPAQIQHAASQVAEQRLPPPPPSAASTAAPSEWQLAAAFDLSFFSSTSRVVPGFDVHLTQRPIPELAIMVGVQFGHSHEDVHYLNENVGSVRFTTTSGLFGLRYTATLPDVDLSAGAGLRVGLVHMAGATDRTTVTSKEFYAPFGGPLVMCGLAYRIGSHARINFDLEAGLVTQPAEARIGPTVVMELSGAWGGAALGFGWTF